MLVTLLEWDAEPSSDSSPQEHLHVSPASVIVVQKEKARVTSLRRVAHRHSSGCRLIHIVVIRVGSVEEVDSASRVIKVGSQIRLIPDLLVDCDVEVFSLVAGQCLHHVAKLNVFTTYSILYGGKKRLE